jgi:hypothetical protein
MYACVNSVHDDSTLWLSKTSDSNLGRIYIFEEPTDFLVNSIKLHKQLALEFPQGEMECDGHGCGELGNLSLVTNSGKKISMSGKVNIEAFVLVEETDGLAAYFFSKPVYSLERSLWLQRGRHCRFDRDGKVQVFRLGNILQADAEFTGVPSRRTMHRPSYVTTLDFSQDGDLIGPDNHFSYRVVDADYVQRNAQSSSLILMTRITAYKWIREHNESVGDLLQSPPCRIDVPSFAQGERYEALVQLSNEEHYFINECKREDGCEMVQLVKISP